MLSISCDHSGSPKWHRGRESAYNAGDMGSIPAFGRSPGKGNGNPLQYHGLQNFMDSRAWWVTAHGVSKRQTWLSDWTHTRVTILPIWSWCWNRRGDGRTQPLEKRRGQMEMTNWLEPTRSKLSATSTSAMTVWPAESKKWVEIQFLEIPTPFLK